MPFDGSAILDKPEGSTLEPRGLGNLVSLSSLPASFRPRPIPAWRVSPRRECVHDTVAVLTRARALIADERRWCKCSFARGWLDIPVPVRSVLARRYCALGAILRAGRELGLPFEEACDALKWQTVIPVADWNDDRRRTHSEVIAGFDAAITALDLTPA